MRSSSIQGLGETDDRVQRMTTESDLGAAAAALFQLHASPMITSTTPMQLQSQLIGLNMPSLNLPGQSIPSTSAPMQFPISGPAAAAARASPAVMGRPRSQSWAPGASSVLSSLSTANRSSPDAKLLSLLQVESDSDAVDTLRSLMKSSPKVEEAEPKTAGRPRSQSMSAAAVLQQNQQARVSKGLRPRTMSVSSLASNPPSASGPRKIARPRAFSQSSRVSARSLGSNKSPGGGRKRAASLDSSASFFNDIDEEFDSEDFDNAEDEGSGETSTTTLDDLSRVGAYSPASRRKRIERFIEKRAKRIWRKRIKYDVRKNFADSRLRVKGRFVRKEDEEQLRGFLQMI